MASAFKKVLGFQGDFLEKHGRISKAGYLEVVMKEPAIIERLAAFEA